MVLCRHILRHA